MPTTKSSRASRHSARTGFAAQVAVPLTIPEQLARDHDADTLTDALELAHACAAPMVPYQRDRPQPTVVLRAAPMQRWMDGTDMTRITYATLPVGHGKIIVTAQELDSDDTTARRIHVRCTEGRVVVRSEAANVVTIGVEPL